MFQIVIVVFLIGWRIEFRLGATLLGQQADVFINYPILRDKSFERHTYYQLPWFNESAIIDLNLAGSFHYYVTDWYVLYISYIFLLKCIARFLFFCNRIWFCFLGWKIG